MNHSPLKYSTCELWREENIFSAEFSSCRLCLWGICQRTRISFHYSRSSCLARPTLRSRRRKGEKQRNCFINFGSCHRQNVAREISRSCEKNSTCGSYFARFSWSFPAHYTKHIFSCHVHVLGKYYDRATWNYHPRSDIKATPASAYLWWKNNDLTAS